MNLNKYRDGVYMKSEKRKEPINKKLQVQEPNSNKFLSSYHSLTPCLLPPLIVKMNT